jgi:hypothetical protein
MAHLGKLVKYGIIAPSAEGTPAGGASAAPAGGRIQPVPRAASGIMLIGTRTGPGGASLDWDWRARVTPVEEREIFRPRLVEPTSCLVPGSLAWSRARGPQGPTVRAVVERRQASALCKARAAPQMVCADCVNLSASCGGYGTASCRRSASLFFRCRVRAERNKERIAKWRIGNKLHYSIGYSPRAIRADCPLGLFAS